MISRIDIDDMSDKTDISLPGEQIVVTTPLAQVMATGVKHACPDCGSPMEDTILLTMPPIAQARCMSCGAIYTEAPKGVSLEPLPPTYKKAR